MMSYKSKIVNNMCSGIDYLMKKNKIKRINGFGQILSKNSVKVTTEDGQVLLETANTVIATGSVPTENSNLPIDRKNIITSNEAISLTKVPKKIVVVGAGVIGLELGSVWNRLGSEIVMVEFMPSLFGGIDHQTASFAETIYQRQGLKFLFEHKVVSSEIKEDGNLVTIQDKMGNLKEIDCEIIFVAIGRRPYTDGLGLKNLNIELTDTKRIKVNSRFQTSVDNIYAVGDVIEGPMLAHKSEKEGVAVAEIIAGSYGHVNYETIPWIIYTWPEVAWIGKGEEELKKEGTPYKTGKAFFKTNARSLTLNEREGQVKILAHKETDKLLGAFIVGPRASDMIAELCIGMEFGASSEDIARSFHAHPTLSEIIKEASMSVDNWSIHT